MGDADISVSKLTIQTCEMHTCGEPLRIIEEGFPTFQGQTILEKIEYIRKNLDYVRKFLMFEPRGHYDMYGALQVEPDIPDADAAFIFFHNEGYSTMCGHAVLALGRYCVDKGMVIPKEPETKIQIQCPCGLVVAYVTYKNGVTSLVRFHSVPSFVFAEDIRVKIDGGQEIFVDISYGGAFYALISSEKLGIKLEPESTSLIVELGDQISQATKKVVRPEHPAHKGLSFLYGTIIYDVTNLKDKKVVKLVTVFADAQLDRSPCGSGTTAVCAYLHKKGLIKEGEENSFKSAVNNTQFTGKVVKSSTYAKYDAVIVEVSGIGHYTGRSTFTAEESDTLSSGFIVNR